MAKKKPTLEPVDQHFNTLCEHLRNLRSSSKMYNVNMNVIELERAPIEDGKVGTGLIIAKVETELGNVTTTLFCPDLSEVHSYADQATERALKLAFDSTSKLTIAS